MSNLLVNINDKNISVEKQLKKTYGLGKTLSLKLCKQMGICSNQKLKELDSEQLEILTKQIASNKLKIDQTLKQKIIENSELLLKIKCHRGIRKKLGYPVRGQRTHSNAKTAKKRLR